MKLSILMPVYDERETVERAIQDALSADLSVDERELIVVDDGSTDGTRELLQAREWAGDSQLVLHDRNRGKGAAVRTALAHATGDYATILDADLEYEAASIEELLEPLRDGERAVYGVRGFQSHSRTTSGT